MLASLNLRTITVGGRITLQLVFSCTGLDSVDLEQTNILLRESYAVQIETSTEHVLCINFLSKPNKFIEFLVK